MIIDQHRPLVGRHVFLPAIDTGQVINGRREIVRAVPEPDWLGAPMFFSHHGVKRNRALIRRAGFELEEAVVEREPEDRHDAAFLWVVARKPRHPGGGEAADAERR